MDFTNIYFVRHGEVVNPDKIWYGRMPFFSLSEKGKSEIEKVAKFLLNKHIDVIYSSPLLRAKQSAQIIKKALGLSKIYYSRKILEVNSLSYQGKPLSFLDTIKYRVFAAPDNKVVGETIEQLSQRMQKFISQIVKLYKGKNIVVVSHGDPIMIVKAKTENRPVNIESIRRNTVDYIKPGGIYLLKI